MNVEFLKEAPNFLKYGIMGLGMFLAILSFYLIYIEQKKPVPRKAILTSTYVYMVFSFAILLVGVYSELNVGNGDDPLVIQPDTTNSTRIDQDFLDSLASLWQPPVDPNNQSITTYSRSELFEYVEANEEKIKALFICGAHLQNGFRGVKESVKKILLDGGSVKVVLSNPRSSTTLSLQSERKKPPTDTTLLKSLVLQTISDLKTLRTEVTTGNLQVRLLSRPLDERIHIVNPESDSSRAYLKLYPFKHTRAEGVTFGGLYFWLDKSRDDQAYLHDYYTEKFNNYFSAGQELEL